jgi:hypothetical protein
MPYDEALEYEVRTSSAANRDVTAEDIERRRVAVMERGRSRQ